MKRFFLMASVCLALLFVPQEAHAEGFSGDFSIIGGEITEETPAAPSEPETPAPVEPETPAPVEPETPAPVEPEKPAPVEPEKPAPVEPEKPTPVEPEKPAPVEPEKPAPVEPEKPAPAEPEKPAPVEPEKPAAPSAEQVVLPAPSTEQVVSSAPSAEQVVSSAQAEEVPLAEYLGEVVTIDDEPTPGQGYRPVSDSSNEGKASDTGSIAIVIAWMALASMIIFFLLKRIYAVEEEKDGEYTVTKKFFRLSKAAEFLKDQNVSRIQIRNTWRRDDLCIVYKFEGGAESSEFATQKEANTLKKVLGYVVPEEVLL